MSCTASASRVVIASVPLMSARPSLGSTSMGVSPWARKRGRRRRCDHRLAQRPIPGRGARWRSRRAGRGPPRRPASRAPEPTARCPRRAIRQQRLDQLDAHAGQPRGERARAEQDHAADHLVVETWTRSGGVAEHDRSLQQGAVGRVDGAVRQRAETGGDAVHDRAFAVEAVDDVARRAHPRSHPGVEGDGLALAGGPHHGVDGQRAAVDSDHAASSLLDRSASTRRTHGAEGRGRAPRTGGARTYVMRTWIRTPRPHRCPPRMRGRRAPPAPASGRAAGRSHPALAVGAARHRGHPHGRDRRRRWEPRPDAAAASTASRLAADGYYARAVAVDEAIAPRTGPLLLLDPGRCRRCPPAAAAQTLHGVGGGARPSGQVDAAVALYRSVTAPPLRRPGARRDGGAPPHRPRRPTPRQGAIRARSCGCNRSAPSPPQRRTACGRRGSCRSTRSVRRGCWSPPGAPPTRSRSSTTVLAEHSAQATTSANSLFPSALLAAGQEDAAAQLLQGGARRPARSW